MKRNVVINGRYVKPSVEASSTKPALPPSPAVAIGAERKAVDPHAPLPLFPPPPLRKANKEGKTHRRNEEGKKAVKRRKERKRERNAMASSAMRKGTFSGANVFLSRSLVAPEVFDALHDALRLNGAQVFLCCDPSRSGPNDYHVISSPDHVSQIHLLLRSPFIFLT